MIYCILFFILLSLAIFTHYKKINIECASLCLFITFLFVGGLRYQVGTDWYLYVGNFQNFISGAWDVKMAFSRSQYDVIAYLISLFTHQDSVYIFLIFISAFTIKYGVMKRYSVNIYFSLLLYLVSVFIIFDINGLRQGLALSFVMLSLHFVVQRKPLYYLLCVVFATLIHESAIIFLPFYWVAHIPFSFRKRIVYTLVAISIAILLSWFMSRYGCSLLAHFSSFYSERFYQYAHGYQFGNPVCLWDLSSLRKLMVWGIIVYLARDSRNSLIQILLNAYSLSLVVFFLFSFSAEVASRMSFYYGCFEIILIPNILFSERFRSNVVVNIITSAIVLLYLFLLCKIVFNPVGNLIIYDNVLFNLFR